MSKINRLTTAFGLFILIISLFPGQISAQAKQAIDFNTDTQTEPTSQQAQVTRGSHTVYLPGILNHVSNSTTSTNSSIFGAELSSFLEGGGLKEMDEAGTYWIRRNAVLWAEVEPVQGQIDWSALSTMDEELKRAAEMNKEVILIVRSTPTWARVYPDSTCGPIKREAFPAFANFMRALVNRYSQAPYSVKYFEIGNEPDAHHGDVEIDWPFGCWGDVNLPYYGGEYYGEMLNVVYPSIKAANADAQVLTGGLLLDCDPRNPPQLSTGQLKDCTSSTFLEGIIQATGGNAFDGVSFHSYEYYYGTLNAYGNDSWNSAWNTTGPTIAAKVSYLKDLLNQYQLNNKYLMNTEVALQCYDTRTCDQDYEITKASQLVQSFAIGMAENLRSTVWYDVFGSWQNSGLLYRDHSPRPAYNAFAFMQQLLSDANVTKKIEAGSITGYEFSSASRRVWLVWSADGSTHKLDLSSQPSNIYDTQGASLTIANSVNVGPQPVYVEWSH
jgi:hypothetical protein